MFTCVSIFDLFTNNREFSRDKTKWRVQQTKKRISGKRQSRASRIQLLPFRSFDMHVSCEEQMESKDWAGRNKLFIFFFCKVLQEWTWYHIAINKCTCSGGGGGWRERESWRGGGSNSCNTLYLMFTGESYPPPKKNNYAFKILNTCILSKNRFTRIPWLRICTRRKILNFIIWHIFQAGVGVGVNLVQNHEIWLHTLTLYWLMDNYLVPVWE